MKCFYSFICPCQLLGLLVLLHVHQFSKGLKHLSHIRNMVAEIVHQSNELQKSLLSFWKWEVKELKSLLFGEWGTCAGYQVSHIFNYLETEYCLCWVGCDLLFAKPFQYLARYSLSVGPCINTSSIISSSVMWCRVYFHLAVSKLFVSSQYLSIKFPNYMHAHKATLYYDE